LLNQPNDPLWTSGASVALGLVGSRLTRDPRQFHVALILRDGEGCSRLLHLAWHKKLVFEEWNSSYHWIPFDGLDIEVQETLVDYALVVAATASVQEIPYSTLFDVGPHFDPEGKYVRPTLGFGLTCSTFILAICEDFGLPLIDRSTWPAKRLADEKWFERITKKLEEYVPRSEWLAQRNQRHLLRRYRPEEVFACAELSDGKALTFSQIEPEVRKIISIVPR